MILLGGSNHGEGWPVETADGLTRMPVAAMSADGHVVGITFETYRIGDGPDGARYWLHDSLTTPEAVAAALADFRAQRKPDAFDRYRRD